MPIDISAVDWAYVGILSGFSFITALIGSFIAFRSRFLGSIIAGILFAIAFVFWTYYPHVNIPGPITPAPVTTAPAAAK